MYISVRYYLKVAYLRQIAENKKTRNSREFDRFVRSLPKRFHSTKHKCKFVESST